MTEVWPPPANEATRWEELRIRTGYAVPPTVVRVRWVLLWGQRVQVNETNDVWCPSCQRFRTVAELGAPFNPCPVGFPARPGPWPVEDVAADDAPRYLPVSSGPGGAGIARVGW